jgi:hypothetical protein
MNDINTMTDIHQSYEDFRLDALLQYDLADEEEEVADSESAHSGIVDDAIFDELYTSIPDDILCDESITGRHDKESFTRSPSLIHATKFIRSVPSRNKKNNQKVNEEVEGAVKLRCNKQQGGLMQSVTKLLRTKQIKLKRFSSSVEKCRNQRGVERNVSTKTEGTLSSHEDVAHCQIDDDLSCSVCYLDEDEDEEEKNDAFCESKRKSLNSSASTSSEVFADDSSAADIENGKNSRCELFNDKLHCSFASNGEALVDACYDIILNNNSMDSAISLDIDDDDDDEDSDVDYSQKIFTTNDPMLNRSLPIIESRGLQDLFFDDYDHNEALTERCHRSVASTASATGKTSRRHRRPYTICDF